MVGEDAVLAVAAHLREMAPRLAACEEKHVDMLQDGTILSGFTPDWKAGTVTIMAAGEMHVDARPKDPVLVRHAIGTFAASTFTVIAETRIGDPEYVDGHAASVRLGWIADVLDRAVMQDRRRLERHERAAAATAGRLAAILSAHVEDAENGVLTLSGPHSAFSFEPLRRDGKPATIDAEFTRLVDLEAALAPPMTTMSAVMGGENLEIRLRSCRTAIQQADPMQTIRALAEIDRLHGDGEIERKDAR